jgi:hypothetical protein
VAFAAPQIGRSNICICNFLIYNLCVYIFLAVNSRTGFSLIREPQDQLPLAIE